MPPKSLKNERLGLIKKNNQGYDMKIIEYTNRHNIVVEFQDKYKKQVKTRWQLFEEGSINNPYHPSVYEKGIVGDKYVITKNGKATKEYNAWFNIMIRCFDETVKQKRYTYENVTICEEWLYFPNFYEWIHSQENFDKWYNGKRWAVDKDILIKGNKIYSPETCCLVPLRVNNLFIKSDAIRGDFPIGVTEHKGKFVAECNHIVNGKKKNYIGIYDTVIEAFKVYKNFKEKYIKRVAQEEYGECNITKKCYNAMMSYQVEITD